MTASWSLLCGDAREQLRTLPAESVQCIVTSPPYWGLRDYNTEPPEWPAVPFSPMAGLPAITIPAQRVALGLEPDPWSFVGHLVLVFREVRRVLRRDGTLWLNLGDCFASTGGAGWQGKHGARASRTHTQRTLKKATATRLSGLKPKDLCGIPWRVAFALQADGWWLRMDNVWAKQNCLPESVEDRPTKAHEMVFLLARSARYAFHADAIREPDARRDHARSVLTGQPSLEPSGGLRAPHSGLRTIEGRDGRGRNVRSVWSMPTVPFPGAHSATFPPALPERCVLAGSVEGEVVLDPFAGSGTVGAVAVALGRRFVGIELNPEYCAMAERRIGAVSPLFEAAEAS